MILTNVYLKGFGPYSDGAELEIENDVTVLTGANDTGKSVTLRLIRLLNGNRKANEADRNVDAFDDESGVWFTFQVGETNDNDSDSSIHKIEVLYDDEYGSLEINRIFDRSDKEIEVHSATKPSPEVLFIRIVEEIRPVFEVRRANSAEKLLLQMAFDSVWEDALANISTQDLRAINRKLSKNLSSLISPSSDLTFHIHTLPGAHPRIAIDLEDKVGAITSITQRGSGYNRLLSYLLLLSAVDFDGGPVILLIDEPEASLHADGQHALRYYLEKIASRPSIQIVYATHSSAMINPLRPRCLRLLQRTKSESGFATSQVLNEPYKSRSYSLVRNSLGMTPGDSLLFSSITVIVEGVTEELALSRLLERLVAEWKDGQPKDLDITIGQIHVVSAEGFGDVSKCAIFAQSQGSRPIAFVDGDVVQAVQDKLDEHATASGEVPLIHVLNEREFEEVVEIKTYFQALAEFIVPREDVCVQKFEDWYEAWKSSNDKEISKFSGRVELWIKCEFPGQRYYKHKVMLKAVDLASVCELRSPEVLDLIGEIRDTLESLNRLAIR